MEKVEAYKASDGQLFNNADNCKEHEVSLEWRERVEEYMNSDYCRYKRNTHSSMCRSVIVSWEQFKSEQGRHQD